MRRVICKSFITLENFSRGVLILLGGPKYESKNDNDNGVGNDSNDDEFDDDDFVV